MLRFVLLLFIIASFTRSVFAFNSEELACLNSPETCTKLNLLPLYGNKTKNKLHLEADQKFLAYMDSKFTTRTEAAQESAKRGWYYLFFKNDPVTAMKRFNQAWLLNPDSATTFHGFAVLTGMNQFPRSEVESYFKKALELSPNDPAIYVDYGHFLNTEMRYKEARSQLTHALEINPKQKNALFNISNTYYIEGNKEKACEFAHKAREIGDKVPDQLFKEVC